MPDTTANIRQLPIYLEGFHAGQDVGFAFPMTWGKGWEVRAVLGFSLSFRHS